MAQIPSLTESERKLGDLIDDIRAVPDAQLYESLRAACARHQDLTDQGYRGGQCVDRIYAYRCELAARGLPSTATQIGY